MHLGKSLFQLTGIDGVEVQRISILTGESIAPCAVLIFYSVDDSTPLGRIKIIAQISPETLI